MIPPPHYNLAVNLWRLPNLPTGTPDLVFFANLAFGKRFNEVAEFGLGSNLSSCTTALLLCPPGTDIRCGYNGAMFDCVEVPAGTGRHYFVLGVEDAGKGFLNEHRNAVLKQVDTVYSAFWSDPYGPLSWPLPAP